MSGLATKETNKSVTAYIDSIPNASKKEDSKVLSAMMEEITGYPPKIWGDHFIIGFGKYTYTRKHGKEEFEWFHVGFAPRKAKITLYLTYDIGQYEDLLKQLGKCTWGRGCLYINKLADINLDILKQLISKSKSTS
jgi:hypothetical protein